VRDQRSAEACRQQGRPSSNGEIGRHFCDEDAPEIEPRGDLAMESIIDQPPGSLAAFLDLAGLYAVASTEIVVVSTIFGRPAGPRPLIALLTAKWTARLTASGSPVDYFAVHGVEEVAALGRLGDLATRASRLLALRRLERD
jgi:hypothetical protein